MDRVNEVTRECFNAVVQLRGLDDAALPSPPVVHARLKAFVDALMQRVRQAGYSREDADDIAYAVVALADEVALSRTEALRQHWLSQPLQLLYFGENQAGEGFFTRLETIRRDPRRRDVARVYLLALLFGFQGRYRVRGGELELMTLVDELRGLVARGRDVDVETLSPSGERPEEAVAARARGRPLALVAGGALAAALLLAVGLRVWLGVSASSVVDRIAAANLP
jgi:type VI secretion system protein ImpK